MKKIKTDVHQIPSRWETARLVVQNTEQYEVENLQEIYDNCAYIGEWTGVNSDEPNAMQKEFEHKNLPPDGKPGLHRLQTIKLKTEDKIIGYLALYHGFPDEQTLWVVVLAVHTDYQGKKFGQEAISGLAEEAKKLQSYKNLGLTVSIKNWPALRFWINGGFKTILKLNGDKVYSEKTFADLWLARKI